jgi:uncharacterized protein YbjQ (UPF0145 family)
MADQAVPLTGVSWSSSLSVAEAAAVREAGFQPRGLVLGSSVYHLGISYSPNDYYTMSMQGGGWGGPMGGGPFGGGRMGGPMGGGGRGWGGGQVRFPGWLKYYSANDLGWGGGWGGAAGVNFGGYGLGYAPAAVSWERTVWEDGVEQAAALAIERITAETSALGAHGVIGTRLNFRYLPEMPSTIEFTAMGTAVAREGAAALPRPFTSHLTGQDLLKLLQAGMVPVSVAVGAGSVVAEVAAFRGGSTVELVPFGDAVEMSRQLASERLRRALRVPGAAVLGTLASSGMEGEGRGQVMSTVLTGTLVRRFAQGDWQALPLTIMRLSKP